MYLPEDMVEGHKAQGNICFHRPLKVGYHAAGITDAFMGQHNPLRGPGCTPGIEDCGSVFSPPVKGFKESGTHADKPGKVNVASRTDRLFKEAGVLQGLQRVESNCGGKQ